MSKLKRDIASWSKRVMMSKSRVWAVVEGKSLDAPFYEGVLAQSLDLDSVEIIEVEDIEMDGKSAGGKLSALKAFYYFEAQGTLRQSNSSTTVDWLFLVDRDDDDFTETVVDSPHVIYTHHADVEAEVMANVDLTKAVATAYSLSTAVVSSAALPDPLADLGQIWTHWIMLRLAACACGVGSARFAQQSQVHARPYGSHDPSLTAVIVAKAEADVGAETWQAHASAAEAFVERRRLAGELSRSVKGKWVPPYIAFALRQRLGATHELPNINPQQLLTVSVAKLDFTLSWADYYRTRMETLLAA